MVRLERLEPTQSPALIGRVTLNSLCGLSQSMRQSGAMSFWTAPVVAMLNVSAGVRLTSSTAHFRIETDKTDHGRMFLLNPGVVAALRVWKELKRTVILNDLVLTDKDGKLPVMEHLVSQALERDRDYRRR